MNPLVNPMPRFTIQTLGCKVNQCESQAIGAALAQKGWKAVFPGETADYCLVNTCTVTQKASMQSRGLIRRLRRAHPECRLAVTGCYAQTEPEALAAIAGVDLVVGHGEKHRLAQILEQWEQNGLASPRFHGDILKTRQFAPLPGLSAGSRSRAFLKVQDGCHSFCTYCIVPYARGPSRSMAPEQVVEQLGGLADRGYQEAVLTGIHLGAYGTDLDPRTDLAGLLARIEAARPIARLRLSSVEPPELSPAIIEEVAGSPRFCPHFHLPLQSGDDAILKRMGRPYDRALFAGLVEAIHERIPEAAIGVDLLVGFPGESEQAFENSHELIAGLPVSYLHVFPFSPRPGTPAARYPDPVPHSTIKARAARLRKLGAEKKAAFFDAMVGRTVTVLVEEGPDRRSRQLKGVSENYLPVRLVGPESARNQRVRARIQQADPHRCQAVFLGMAS